MGKSPISMVHSTLAVPGVAWPWAPATEAQAEPDIGEVAEGAKPARRMGRDGTGVTWGDKPTNSWGFHGDLEVEWETKTLLDVFVVIF